MNLGIVILIEFFDLKKSRVWEIIDYTNFNPKPCFFAFLFNEF